MSSTRTNGLSAHAAKRFHSGETVVMQGDVTLHAALTDRSELDGHLYLLKSLLLCDELTCCQNPFITLNVYQHT